MTPVAPHGELEALLHKQAILEVLYRYCRGCDRSDEATLRACFHPDSTHCHGGFEGSSTDFCALALKIVGSTKASKHVLSNVLIELEGDCAVSESHYFAYQRQVDTASGAETDYFTGGRYLDRLERRDGVWRIVRRVGLIDFERREPAQTLRYAPAALGGRYPSDALYRDFLLRGGEF